MGLRSLSLALVGAVGLFAGVASAQMDGPWNVAVVQPSRIDNRVILGGTVVPARQVTISAQMGGRVEYIAGSEGDSFPANTKLIALNDDALQAQRRAALAQMANAAAALRNAGMQYTRELVNPYSSNRMPGMGLPSMFDSFFTRPFGDMMGTDNSTLDRQAQLYARGTNIAQAQGAYQEAQSRLQEVQAKLRDTVGYSPFNGVITRKMVEVGDTVQPGQPLLRYADTSKLEIKVQVPSRLLLGLSEGQTVPARLDVSSQPISVQVVRIYPMANPQRHTVTVKFAVPASSPAAPGMYAEVMVADPQAGDQPVPTVPISALVRRGSLPSVFVMRRDGKIEMRLVRVGEPVGGGRIGILSGVHLGEHVITNPRPGMASSSAVKY